MAKPSKDTTRSDALKALIVKTLDDNKAQDIVVLDLAGKTSICDWMVIASGSSTRQVAALADYVARALKDSGHKGVSVEGKSASDWVLIDGGDVIVHVFRPEFRDLYQLERLWSFPVDVDALPAPKATRRKADADVGAPPVAKPKRAAPKRAPKRAIASADGAAKPKRTATAPRAKAAAPRAKAAAPRTKAATPTGAAAKPKRAPAKRKPKADGPG